MYSHFAGGEGAGFIETDGVDAGESFYRVEILDQDFLTRETDGGEGEDGAGEENEALRDHTDEAGDGASDSDFGGGVRDIKSGPEKKGANGDEGEADVFDDVIDEFKEFRVGGFDSVSAGL